LGTKRKKEFRGNRGTCTTACAVACWKGKQKIRKQIVPKKGAKLYYGEDRKH